MHATKRPVILIPHIVAYPENAPDNDTMLLSLVREALLDRGIDVPLAPSHYRSWELKWIMGQLRAFVGSRMHATIGAMGCCTPTVSVAFSEKAPALNEFLLGHKRFVLKCNELAPDRLTDTVCVLLAEESDVRDALARRLPEVKQLSRSAGQYLKEIAPG
jgi:polysaccharide pyruvyl transferase WcaK-like protein